MNKEKLLSECMLIQKQISQDKELKKVYSDVDFKKIISDIKEEERLVDFAEKLFN